MRELHLLWSRAAVGRPHSRRANAARRTGRVAVRQKASDRGSRLAAARVRKSAAEQATSRVEPRRLTLTCALVKRARTGTHARSTLTDKYAAGSSSRLIDD